VSRLLLRLRYVTDEEAGEIRLLLQDNDIEFYETVAGFFGTGVAAIWLTHDDQQALARSLVEQYQHERQSRVRQEYLSQKNQGEQDTLLKRFKREPVKCVLGVGAIALILYLSLMPFFSL